MNQSAARRVQLTGHHETIKERWFQAGEALIRPYRIALDSIYPMQMRLPTLPKYDKEVADQHDTRLNRTKTFLYEQRNLVNNKWLPRYDIRLGIKTEADAAAHDELSGLLIDGCLDRLCENLGAYAPMLLPQKQADEVTPTLFGILKNESERMREFLSRYNVKLKPGLAFIADDLAD